MKNLYKKQSKLLGFAVLLGFSLFLTSSKVFAYTGQGAGTSDDPYKITDCAEWLEMANDLAGSYIVDGNIDCTGMTYTPIGTSGAPFTGSLNGGGWEISGVSITSGSHLGLFGYTNGATIKNLDFASSTISGSFYIGGIVSDATNTTMSRVRSTVNITATSGGIGGLVGVLRGTSLIEKSSFNGTVSSPLDIHIAGLVAETYGSPTINDSYAAGTLDVNNTWNAGLVAVVSSGTITVARSYSTMTFTHTNSFNAGLIAHFAGGTVTDSFSASTLDGSVAGAGGLFGNGFGTSTNNYFDAYLANTTDCNGVAGTAACTTVNSGNATPNYFKNNSTNDPLDNWNFTSIWSTSAGNYPQLEQMPQSIYLCETPTSTKTAVHLLCDVQSLGDIGTLTWSGRYRIEGASTWTSFTLADLSTGEMDLSGLQPGTIYELGLKYTSSLYGTSYWTNTEVTTDAAPNTGGQGGGSQDDDEDNTASTNSEGYGPVNEDISEDIPAGSSAKNDKTPVTNPLKTPANIFNPKTLEEENGSLSYIIVAGGVVFLLILAFYLAKPPVPASGK